MIDRSQGQAFDDEAVARAYLHRPEYPTALIARLLELAAGRGRALDLGCGPGKLAHALAPHLEQVVAVDPSASMLVLARETPAALPGDIRWLLGRAEDVDPGGPFDLAVAGASIHWMDPAVLFPRLAAWLAPHAPLAIVEGDEPAAAPWIDDYRALLRTWVERLGGTWNDPAYRARAAAHRPWLQAHGRQSFHRQVRQSVDSLIEAEHSRATWSRARMGELAAGFDADLRALLTPWADDAGLVYQVETRLVWGAPRTAPANR